ncbi:FER-like iron deficiency-induced transcription factor [Quillaja saponaria]|uniref:FER-like iron deficiency-induced transcription factor n=1 Tax=Quillaja saponaria TaxID=32244 RepID=A0AAD7KY19_QUISA|nr:FER-like iron deficiency-induced transcription factor [Quillaja saponaria]
METYMNDFELHDFIEDPNFDQFIDLIRGENADPVNNFDCDMLFNAYLVPNQFVSTTPPPTNMFDSNGTVYDPNSILMMSTLSSFNGEVKGGDDHEENDEEDSSATTYTTTTTTNTNSTTKRPKDDRSRTLVSERRRRGRMKEKLYALRALVPNITKMDKASIVGDAVLYVKDLQAQAKKLKAEIAGLEASVLGSEKYPRITRKSNEN